MSIKGYHAPDGDPCARCGRPFGLHRASHVPKGDPCAQCGLKPNQHRFGRRHKGPPIFAGLDGEGQGRSPHRYTLLAASTENGDQQWYVERLEGLSSEECLDFLVNTIPLRVQLFGYALRYDWTMILRDLPDRLIYRLFRPDIRMRKVEGFLRPAPLYWCPRGDEPGDPIYSLNFLATKMSLGIGSIGPDRKVKMGNRRRDIWDTFKFYQCSFVKALKDWNAAPPEEIERIQSMKVQRADFDKVFQSQIRAYCLSECQYMAKLTRLLTEAHEKADLPIKQFYGAGSTASVMLKKHNIHKLVDASRKLHPEEMREPLACSFSGGRFENLYVGKLPAPLYNFDISSAYPYVLAGLPCLAHGTWRKVRTRQELLAATVATVRYELGEPPKDIIWGPFAYRTKLGEVVYPARSAGGWVWREEFLAGERLYGKKYVHWKEAWGFYSECECPLPFSFLSRYYVERVAIGKEGPGYIFKLGPNSAFGKMAQAIGGRPGPYSEWAYAGLIPSGTRAMILDLMGAFKDKTKIYAIATDGILCGEDVPCPQPRETGTGPSVLRDPEGRIVNKPLGGWERSVAPYANFAARPGVFFPLGEEAPIEKVRARGVGRNELYKARDIVVEAFHRGADRALVPGISRFGGAKTSIISRLDRGAVLGEEKVKYTRSPEYGDWIVRDQIVNFDPLPKRVWGKKRSDPLQIRSFPLSAGPSRPYDKAIASQNPEVQMMIQAQDEALEQPDPGQFVDDVFDWGQE